MIVKINEYTECVSQTCPFRKECGQHETAGDFRAESGFAPEITMCGETIMDCKTFSEPILDIGYTEDLPSNYDQLDRGFRKLGFRKTTERILT